LLPGQGAPALIRAGKLSFTMIHDLDGMAVFIAVAEANGFRALFEA
jgi:hypothetical protein